MRCFLRRLFRACWAPLVVAELAVRTVGEAVFRLFRGGPR